MNLKPRDRVHVTSIPGWMSISKPLRVQILGTLSAAHPYDFYAESLDAVAFSDPAYNISPGAVLGFYYSNLCDRKREFRLI